MSCTTYETASPSLMAGPAVFVADRVVARGRFLFAGDRKYLVRGVTYGPFRPDERTGSEYGTPEQVERDFRQMADAGINTIRVYTVPPRWLLDIAQQTGLRVMVGLPWEQHVTFLDTRARRNSIEQRVREGVAQCAGHPAVLAYAVGNEIPASIVRWYGRRRIERFLHRLCNAARAADPGGLVTYVNFPTTEYLQLPFLDFLCFNVYLEEPVKLRRYLDRLHNQAGSKPLVMGEVGLDSLRNGVEKQAEVMDWQIRTTFASGAAGMFVFAWTDQWHRGGHDIEDWDFGLTTRGREPKPALAAVASAYASTPFDPDLVWPRISVLVCTYNGGRTIEQTVRALARVNYPDYEVIVIDDGSQDDTAAKLHRLQQELRNLDLQVHNVPNGGLSRARNLALHHASGEIVAYLDDDAYPDPHWLYYMAEAFRDQPVVGVGGPNLPVPEDSEVATCVAHAPGGPNHVLLSDRVAEHIPGCNMAFRRKSLMAIGGFDEQFRIAGDDVDVCWRLQEHDGLIGFHPAAVVWHHRRNTVKGYLRQQTNYGRAEAMLERKWPEKYNRYGHVAWQGRVYGGGVTLPVILRRSFVYHGVWGSALFQTLYQRAPGLTRSMPLMPEWYLLSVALLLLALPGILWRPMLLLAPVAALVFVIPLVQAGVSAWAARLDNIPSRWQRVRARGLIATLHLLQPVVRLKGRIVQGLAPWRRPRVTKRFAMPMLRQVKIWDERWQAPEQRLSQLTRALHRVGASPISGGPFDKYDLEIRGGLMGGVRVLMALEDHGGGKQLVRLRMWPIVGRLIVGSVLLLTLLAVLSAAALEPGAAIVFFSVVVCLLVRMVGDCASATAAFLECVTPKEL